MKHKLRMFDTFPEGKTCPICGTSEGGEVVLIPKAETIEGGIAEAEILHAGCVLSVLGVYERPGERVVAGLLERTVEGI